jgi:hypothetical protein
MEASSEQVEHARKIPKDKPKLICSDNGRQVVLRNTVIIKKYEYSFIL